MLLQYLFKHKHSHFKSNMNIFANNEINGILAFIFKHYIFK